MQHDLKINTNAVSQLCSTLQSEYICKDPQMTLVIDSFENYYIKLLELSVG